MEISINDIVDHWAAREDECGLAVDWAEAHERCWRCGYRSKLEKCHIIPASLGGARSPHNLVLLCGRCHREAPNHSNLLYMWRWLKATCVPLYDTYWTIRGMEEFEAMFGRKPMAWAVALPEEHSDLIAEFTNALASELRNTAIHFGEGRLNPSTIACVLAEVERAVADRCGVHVPDPPDTPAARGFMAF